ncbi:PqqD family protein [Candidatus Gottesmanbacteria bacterium]|nr:PqqD family protein [Candidatus Gottesmanbacteria bacterium]
MVMHDNAVISRNSKTFVRKTKECLLVVDFDNDIWYSLNESAEMLWKYLWKPRPLSALIRKCEDVYGISVHQAREDVTDFVTEGIKKGYLLQSRPRLQ